MQYCYSGVGIFYMENTIVGSVVNGSMKSAVLPDRQEKKKDIWLSPMTKAPTPKEKPKEHNTNATKNSDYTTMAIRLRMVSWGNDSHPIGVVIK